MFSMDPSLRGEGQESCVEDRRNYIDRVQFCISLLHLKATVMLQPLMSRVIVLLMMGLMNVKRLVTGTPVKARNLLSRMLGELLLTGRKAFRCYQLVSKSLFLALERLRQRLQVQRRCIQLINEITDQLRETWVKNRMWVAAATNHKLLMFLSIFTAQALLIYSLLGFRTASQNTSFPQEQSFRPHHVSSAWYYEHIHYYPTPRLRILDVKDGAAPLVSQLPVQTREITIATHLTMDRFPAVEMTALRWSGPMVVMVFVKKLAELPATYLKLEDLHSRIEAEGRCRLTIQIAVEEGYKPEDQALRALYPVNSMRNLALDMVTTHLFFLIDADLVPNPGLHEHLTQNEDKYMDYVTRTRERNQLLVVPAFQLREDKSIGYQHSLHVLPHTKEEVREAWWNGILDCFLCDVCRNSHQPSEYYEFTDPAITWPYQVWYKEGYEPFYITSKDLLPRFDERFRGYGKDKVSHTYLLSVKDFTFWVLPEGYLTELPHPPSLSQKRHLQDPLQFSRVDGLYKRFVQEVEWVYNVTSSAHGSLGKTDFC